MHTYTSANSISDCPIAITNLFSVLCIFIRNPFMCSCEGGKSFTYFKFGTFISRFPSDSMASMAVEGLICLLPVVQGVMTLTCVAVRPAVPDGADHRR